MRFLLACATGAVLMTAACSRDLSAPTSFDGLPGFGGPGGVRMSDVCRPPVPPAEALAWVDSAPALESYCQTLWVTQGEDQVLTVRYANVEGGGASSWFLRLFIPEDAQLVDEMGVAVPEGTRVPITVAIHPSLYAVRFSPHGSRFMGRPAILKLNYGWADVGSRDPGALAVYYQPDDTQEWAREPTVVDRTGHMVCAELRHFSNYALAW